MVMMTQNVNSKKVGGVGLKKNNFVNYLAVLLGFYGGVIFV
tara:strand:- start:61 stop:183 length:123 start_codon:yes stop_codon:yes gene_type:complete